MATILVVEDHAMSRQVLKNLFGYVGHRVLEAADGTAAVALARAQNPDLIVSDIVMPVMDGIEFIRTVRLERGLASVPVIFYTATYRLAEARRLASEFGMCRVIHKPADPPFILEIVNEMLGISPAEASLPEKTEHQLPDSSKLEVFQNAGLRLAMLMDLNFHLVGQRDPVRLLETCCSAIRSILNCRYARLALPEENGQTRYFGEDKREEPAEIGATAGLHMETILDQVISERSTFRWSGRSATGFDGKPETRCADVPFLILPFASRTRVYGWICIADKGDGAPFRDEDEEFAVALAAQSSIAYENIIIYERLQSQAADLRTHQLELQAQNEELRAAQKELESSRTKYADLYNFAPIGYFSLDTNGVILEVNFAGANLLGTDKQALLNKPFSLLLSEPDKEVFRKHRKTTFTSQNRQTCDLSLRRKDGTVFVQLKSIAVENADNKAGYIRTAVMDITERKRAEEALRESEHRYRSLFEHMLDGLAYCKMLFDDRGRPLDFVYLAVNDSFERLTGLSNVTGKKVTEAIPGIKEAHPDLFERYARVASTGQPDKFEIAFRPLGIWLSISVYSPKKDHFVALFDNITERKRAEEELRKVNDDLARFNRIAVGRELRMIELKKEINELCGCAGEPPRYPLEFENEQM